MLHSLLLLTYQPYLGNSRLIGGDKENWGLLQVAHTGQWGSVCGRRKGVDFSDKAANVACRNMGFEVSNRNMNIMNHRTCKAFFDGVCHLIKL